MYDDIELLFQYANHSGQNKPLTFKNPIDVIVARNIDDVVPCLEKVEHAVDNGYYAAGYLSYESAPAFDNAFQVNHSQNVPLLWFGIFKEPIKEQLQSPGDFSISEWKPSVSKDEYEKNIRKIKAHIENGDTYQVNYTTRFHAQFKGDAKRYYHQLAKAQTSDYSAYLNTGDFSILSASPELFFHLYENKLTTRPMKGTVKRGKSAREDAKLADWLYHSEKNRAENVMIVDLLRNDLGVIAKTGSVKVPHLFKIEQYPTVYQMTSTVTAEVDTSLVNIFKALFPCGSITGAPKISTTNIIKELETTPRNVYCGAIGYITPSREAIFNVPIRTVLINNETGAAEYGVGGGITWDSTAEDEYEEMLIKTKLLHEKQNEFELLETFGLYDGKYIVLEKHMDRLKKSAAFFHYFVDGHAIEKELMLIAKKHRAGSYRVRLLVQKNGAFTTEVIAFQTLDPIVPKHVSLANEPIQKDNVSLYHKTTNRAIYQKHHKQHPESFDVLLWNEACEVTEFTIGNIVVELEGELVTPPVTCGLLPGTYRQKLLEEQTIHERIITIHDLQHCTQVWLINSVRKWVPVTFASLQPHM